MEKRTRESTYSQWKRPMDVAPMIVALRLNDCLDLDRIGVIPYIVLNKRRKYLLARDSKTNELGDFGGGIKYGSETPLQAALRELSEESREIFSRTSYGITLQKLERSPAIFHRESKAAIIFVQIHPQWERDAGLRFVVSPARDEVNKEISGIKWVSEKNLIELIKKRKKGMWRKIRHILGSIDSKILVEGIGTASGSRC